MKDHKLFNQEIDVTRIDNDTKGNPRYVIHFLCVARRIEAAIGQGDAFGAYERTLRFIQGSGWKKYHNKRYGGGLVVQSFSIDSDLRSLEYFVEKEIAEYLLYTVSPVELQKWAMNRTYTHKLTTRYMSSNNTLEVSFMCRDVVIKKRINYDHMLNGMDNHIAAAIIGTRLANRADVKYTFELDSAYSETKDGYTFTVVAKYKGDE